MTAMFQLYLPCSNIVDFQQKVGPISVFAKYIATNYGYYVDHVLTVLNLLHFEKLHLKLESKYSVVDIGPSRTLSIYSSKSLLHQRNFNCAFHDTECKERHKKKVGL